MTQGTFPQGSGYAGQEWFLTGGSPLNAMAFLTRQIIAGKAFAAIVKVMSVTNAGGIVPVGSVSVQPMVDQIDGFGNRVAHGVVYSLPYFRLQGGANAIILDPVAGDLGLAVICDRDISTLKATKAQAGPGSRRQNDWADGCYFGGFLNGTPTNYVSFSSGGIDIVSTGSIGLTSTALTHNGVNIGATHVHSDPQGGNTGPPH